MLRRFFLTGFLLLLALPLAGYAQGTDVQVNTTRLETLYDAQLKGSKDPTLEKRIQTERERVRGQIDDRMNDLINALTRSGTGSISSLSEEVSQQRAVLSSLQTSLDSTEADLDVLAREHDNYYAHPSTETGATEDGRVSTSEANLLARRAVLEEQQKSITFFVSLQQDRLNRLLFQQRLQQFSILITIGKYVLLFLVVVVVERLIRLQFLTRIRSQNARYVSMKLFTACVYVVTGLWIISQISGEYPGTLTSFAIVGAGIAIALQDIFKDLVGWLLIVQKRLFALGHRITIGGYTGDVVDIGLLSTTLLEVTNSISPDASRANQVLSLPNALVLTQPLLNYSTTSDYVDAELTCILTFDSDITTAEEICRTILTEETQQYMERARRQTSGRLKQFYTSHEPQGSRVYLEPVGTGIRITLRFPVPIGERRIVVTRLTKKIMAALAAANNMQIAADPHNPVPFPS